MDPGKLPRRGDDDRRGRPGTDLQVGSRHPALDPVVVHFYERDAVAFQVIDSLDGDSVRGDYAGPYPGVVRPELRWTTEYAPAEGAGARTEARRA